MMQLADYFACQVSLIEKSNPFKPKTKTPNGWGEKRNKERKKRKEKRRQGAIFENRGGFVLGDYKKPGLLG